MAAIDSRQAGVLQPTETTGADAPELALRTWLSSLTGIPIDKVRRRWVRKPGTMPAIGEDWAALGVTTVKSHGTPYQRATKGVIDVAESGTVTRESHQTLTVMVSFYGEHAAYLSDLFRESSQLGQNASALAKDGLTLQGVVSEVTHVPDLLNEQWVDRYDVVFDVGRKVARTYGVRDLASVGRIELKTEKGVL